MLRSAAEFPTLVAMKFAILRESRPGERRVALIPESAAVLLGRGHTIDVEKGAGEGAGYTDDDYVAVGCQVVDFNEARRADVLLGIRTPEVADISSWPNGRTFIGLVTPSRHPEQIAAASTGGHTVYALDRLPRITRAQSMDVLSSQNNLAGYKSVLVAAEAAPNVFPLMMTAAGTIRPARVLIYGAGVAGLQAIATARRLGAMVEVTDIRPETREQVESLGATFLSVEGLDRVVVTGGYVGAVDDDVLQRQREVVRAALAKADVVILTALVAGGTAPTLVHEDDLAVVRRGTVIVDLAADAGGNCVATRGDERRFVNGVLVIGCPHLAATVPTTASRLWSKNLLAFLEHIVQESGLLADVGDEIVAGTMVVVNGQER